MSKRFLDSDVWKKKWFRELPSSSKCLWIYLLTNCDSVGVWEVDQASAEFHIGEKINWDGFFTSANGNIEKLSDKKWWIVDFCSFQYGDIREVSKSNVQKALVARLKSHGLLERYFDRVDTTVGSTVDPTVGPTLQKKKKEKDKEKDKEKERIEWDFECKQWDNISDEMVDFWSRAYPAVDVETELGAMGSWLTANPTKRKSQYARFITNWLKRQQDKGGSK